MFPLSVKVKVLDLIRKIISMQNLYHIVHLIYELNFVIRIYVCIENNNTVDILFISAVIWRMSIVDEERQL